MPLMGVGEEIGELCCANGLSQVEDAVADIVIYLADYCSAMDWDVQSLFDADVTLFDAENSSATSLSILSVIYGKMCHAHLKAAQGIRGSSKEHAESGKRAASQLLSVLRMMVGSDDLLDTVEKVWSKVKQRDWKKNPVDAAKMVD